MFAGAFVRQYVVVIIANLNVMSTGVGLAWPSPVLVKLSNDTQTPLPHPITEEQGSWIGTAPMCSGLLSSLLAGVIVNGIGRKYTIVLACLPKMVAWILIAAANDVVMLYVARALLGLSDGLTFVVIPMYASEIASKDIRGSLGTLLQIFCTLGIVTVLCVGPFLSYVALGVLGAVVVACTSIPFLAMPESPYYSFSKGRKEECLKTLTFLRGSPQIAAEIMKEFENNEQGEKPSLAELYKSRAFLKGLGIVLVLSIGVQTTGFNAISIYLQTILESTGTAVASETASVIIGVTQLTACICSTLVTDRLGRKTILSTTLIGMCFGMAGLSAYFWAAKGGASAGALQYLPLAGLLLTVASFSAGPGSVVWPLMAELFADEARATGVAGALLGAGAAMAVTTRYFAAATRALGPALTYAVCSLDCLLLAAFVLAFLPETAGRSFADIQLQLAGKEPPGEDD